MKLEKIILLLSFSMFFLVVNVNSAYIAFTSSETGLSVNTYYCDPNDNICLTINQVSPLFVNSTLSSASNFDYDSSSPVPIFKRFYFYKGGKRVEPYVYGVHSTGTFPVTIYPLQGYYTANSDGPGQPAESDLIGPNQCLVTHTYIPPSPSPILNTLTSFTVKLNSNLDTYTSYMGSPVTLPYLLKQYYYMNTNVKVMIKKPDNTIDYIYGGATGINVLLKEYNSAHIINLDYTPTQVGNYQILLRTNTNVEPKCTLRGVDSGDVAIGSFTVTSSAPSIGFKDENDFTITTPEPKFFLSESSPTYNFKYSISNADTCTIKEYLNGSTIPSSTYSASLTGEIPIFYSLEPGIFKKEYKFNCNGLGGPSMRTLTFLLDTDGDNIGDIDDTCPFHYNLGTTFNDPYGIKDDACNPLRPREQMGFIDNLELIECDGDADFNLNLKKIYFTGGDRDNGKLYIISSSNNDAIIDNNHISSNINSWDTNARNLLDDDENYYHLALTDLNNHRNQEFFLLVYSHINDVIGDNYEKEGYCKLRHTSLISPDTYTKNKIACNADYSQCKYLGVNQELSITIPNNLILTNNSRIFKDDIILRDEKPNPYTIALLGHYVNKFHNQTQAQDFVTNTLSTMENLEYEKRLTYNQALNKTTIRIDLKSINPQIRQNLTVYQVVPKRFANSLNQINIIDNGGGVFFISDKDPVIGWYFNETDPEESIEFELPGNNEGGSIIITQTPILFNSDKLIVNYREVSCNPGEIELFELDDIFDSNVYNVASGKLYKVCLRHEDDGVVIQKNNLNNFMHIFNYTNGANMSLTKYLTSLDVSTTTPNMYWDIQFQETQPSEHYSCLGSYNLQDSSKFGDCGYTNNRIWITLGDDITPPTTTLSFPYLAHTVRVSLNADDGLGSGVKDTFYCVGEGCDPIIPYTGEFLVTCDSTWGCSKIIRFYSTDNAGNVESVKEYNLTLIDSGSACQADCTAKPTPNRIIKDCMNLNGCRFYGATLEEQINTSIACHYSNVGSWVRYDATKEILCPNGPLRPAQFTFEKLFYWDSKCDNIIVVKYPVIFNGENVNMVFLHCINED